MNYYDILLISLALFLSGLLFWAAGYAEKVLSPGHRLLYLIPAVTAMLLFGFAGYEKSMLGVYIGAAVCVVGFIREKKTVRRIVSILCAALTVVSIPACLLNKGYRQPDIMEQFETVMKNMEQRYSLNNWKGIDYGELRAKYEPEFEKAAKEHDMAGYYVAMAGLISEYHDGHVGYSADTSRYEKAFSEARERIYGNDYGLVTLNLEDGRTVAVQTARSLREKGIHNGTVITSWDGRSPEEAAKDAPVHTFPTKEDVFINYADSDCEYFFRSIMAAGIGGDTVEVSFIDDSGIEQTVTLEKKGSYFDRIIEAVESLDDGVHAGNFQWTDIDGRIGVLRIKQMFFDSKSSHGENVKDEKSFNEMKESIRSEVEEYKKKGINDVIIDIRGNSGGSGNLIRAVAELFCPKGEYVYCYNALWDDQAKQYKRNADGTYVKSKKNTFTGEDILEGGRVLLLVNCESVSAADHLVHLMRGMENVTVMGFTQSNGSGQGVTSFSVGTESMSLSGSLMLNEDGTPFIDAGSDGKSGNGIDIKIPFDEEALKAVYDDGRDYLLEKAMEYLGR